MKKIIIGIYIVVVLATGISALTYPDIFNVSVESLMPLAVFLYVLILGLMLGFRVLVLYGCKLRTRAFFDSDFKYSKGKGGKGSIEMVDRDVKKVRISNRNSKILSGVLLVSGAVTIPFIFLFPFEVKIIASMTLLAIVVVSISSIALISHMIEMKKAVADLKEKEDREQKELEAQQKREEMGYFK